MLNITDRLFSSDKGIAIYKSAERAIEDFHMVDAVRNGVLLGLSGGADSVMLLLFLLKYRNENFDFPILAVHVNHMIRGKEAGRDEEFSRELCERLGVEFISKKIDVPTLAKDTKKSVEEAARDARYSVFRDIICGRSEINTIAVAHNSDDNLETVIINMLRGAGSRGMSGIDPFRDGIIRPLIYVKKEDISSALISENIDFVTDSTNESDDYTRNYIRHNILPAFLSFLPSVHASAEKMCRNLREDDECLNLFARDFTDKYENGKIPSAELSKLPPSLLFRCLKIYFSDFCSCTLERVHIDAIRSCLEKGTDFSVNVPSALFISSGGLCGFFLNGTACDHNIFLFKLSDGNNDIPEFSASVSVFKDAPVDYSSKIYNISTQASLSSAIIKGDLFIRNKRDGDACFWGGMTHKLKKLFNDRKIPVPMRSKIPILCDEAGIVWLPGFGVRDDGGKSDLSARISVNSNAENSFYLPIGYKKNSNMKG